MRLLHTVVVVVVAGRGETQKLHNPASRCEVLGACHVAGRGDKLRQRAHLSFTG